jgi:hypothetical protein
MFATGKNLYWHHRVRQYPGDAQPRHITHRPWVDRNKQAYWEQSDASMLKLNRLLSGKLEGIYGDIDLETVLNFCNKSGLNKEYTIYDPEYDKKDLYQHGKTLIDNDPIEAEI